VSDELEGLQRKALLAANASDDPAIIEKAVSIAKLIAEAAKLRSEAEKLAAEKVKQEAEVGSIRREARFETARLWLPISVPMLSTLILAGTLAFQVRQFKITTETQVASAQENRKFQEKTAEDAQWRDAIRTLSDAKTQESTLAGVTFLRFFLRSPTYRIPARELAFHYLLQAQNSEVFKAQFNAVMELPTWESFDDYVQLDRLVSDNYDAAFFALENLIPNGSSKGVAKRTESRAVIEARKDELQKEISLISSQIAIVLKTPRSSSAPLDFTRVDLFGGADLQNVSFKGANVHYSNWTANVTGADFSQVTDFGSSSWTYTAWWRSDRMDSPFVKYLVANYPFKEDTNYGVATSAQEYKASVNRLLANSASK
jgi:uncharacterized protein YjbI with pentapeptide repeats